MGHNGHGINLYCVIITLMEINIQADNLAGDIWAYYTEDYIIRWELRKTLPFFRELWNGLLNREQDLQIFNLDSMIKMSNSNGFNTTIGFNIIVISVVLSAISKI